MKKIFIVLLAFIPLTTSASDVFNELFTGEAIRIDYTLSGNRDLTMASLYQIKKESVWSGSRINFGEPFINGNYYIEITKGETDSVIFTKSFNTLFGEWQTTDESAHLNRSFQQSIYFPCPRDPFVFKLYNRKNREESLSLMKLKIDPKDYLIPFIQESQGYITIQENGPPSSQVDLVFIAEGYTQTEKGKFLDDVEKFSEYLFAVEPFDSHRDNFSIRAVYSPSSGSGADDPGESKWIDTPAGTSFYTFGSERYLTSPEYWKICDLLTNVPHDQIIIMVNTDKYGGGGIYNHYSIFSSDHPVSASVFVHEFGHGFVGLGDEYYNSEVAYESFYPLDEEPLPPNLTTLVDFEKKWKDMIPENVPIPTPPDRKYKNTIGLFEGGGYVARGVYRPQLDCRMKSTAEKSFCKVCQKSIEKMIDHYAEE